MTEFLKTGINNSYARSKSILKMATEDRDDSYERNSKHWELFFKCHFTEACRMALVLSGLPAENRVECSNKHDKSYFENISASKYVDIV